MMTTRIGLSLLSIVMALTLMAGATYAFFSDQATTTGNTFSTGNASLEIATHTGSGPGGYGASIEGPTFNNLFPGFSDRSLFWLRNSSTSDVDMDLTADVAATVPASGPLGDTLLIKWRCDVDGNGGIADNTFSPEFTPIDWEAGGNAALGSLEQNEQMICEMSFRIPATATNDVAGKTVTFNGIYDGVQVATP